jgi:hypothetical protein
VFNCGFNSYYLSKFATRCKTYVTCTHDNRLYITVLDDCHAFGRHTISGQHLQSTRSQYARANLWAPVAEVNTLFMQQFITQKIE